MSDAAESAAPVEVSPEAAAEESSAREEALSEVKAILGKAKPEEDDDATSPATPAAKKEEAEGEEGEKKEDPDDPVMLKRLLRAKKQEREFRAKLDAEKQAIASERQAVEAEKQRVREDLGWLQKLKQPESILDAIRAAGWTPQELALAIARDGDPTEMASRQTRTLQQQMEAMQAELHAEREHRRKEQEKQKETEQQQHTQRVYREFVETAMTPDEYPRLSAFYKGRERTLIRDADEVAAECQQKGVGFTLPQIARYLESELEERGYAAPSEAQQLRADSSAHQPSRKGSSRTLAPGQASERRALSVEEDLSPKERKELAAKEARRILRELKPS